MVADQYCPIHKITYDRRGQCRYCVMDRELDEHMSHNSEPKGERDCRRARQEGNK